MTEFLFHTTRDNKSFRRIVESGYLKPSIGTLSFTHSPHLGMSVSMEGHTFVYDADTIYNQYGGEDIDYDSDRRFRGAWKDEEEVEVFEPVAVSDAIEVLPTIAAVRKYASNWKFDYKDSRERVRLPSPGYFHRGWFKK